MEAEPFFPLDVDRIVSALGIELHGCHWAT